MQKFNLGLGLALALVLSPARADDLDDAWKSCETHTHRVMQIDQNTGLALGPFRPPTYDDGWGPDGADCATISAAWETRKAAKDALDDSKNPELAKARAVSKELK